MLAGIGNLPGDLAFFDKKADGKCRSMGNTRWVLAQVLEDCCFVDCEMRC